MTGQNNTFRKILSGILLLTAAVSYSVPATDGTIKTFRGSMTESDKGSAAGDILNSFFSSYELYRLNASEISSFLASEEKNNTSFRLELGNHSWTLDLSRNKITGENFVIRGLTGEGIKEYAPSPDIYTYEGFSNGNIDQAIRFTVKGEYIAGVINDRYGKFILEPIRRYSTGADALDFILYKPEDIIKPAIRCGATDAEPAGFEKAGAVIANAAASCHIIDQAMALDFTAYKKTGQNIKSAELEMIHVLNLVNEIYTGMESAPGNPRTMTYRLVEIFVEQTDANTFNSSLSGGSSNADVILNSFNSWAKNGFKNSYALATIWTSRGSSGNLSELVFSGGAINGLVMDPKPNVCHSLASYQGAPHNLVKWGYFDSWGSALIHAHETGHNWSSGHNGSSTSGGTTFMTNSPNPGTWGWSQYEWNAVNNGMNDALSYSGCLKVCDATAPVANYITTNSASSCSGHVAFINRSTGASAWTWNFGDGSPVSSERDPVHLYANPGIYTVTLTASSGTMSVQKTASVIVNNTANSNPVYTVGVATTAGANASAGINDKLMYFDVLKPVLIKTVTVPANKPGYLTAEIYNSKSECIFKKKFNVVAGDNKINMDAELPPGSYSIGLGKNTIGVVAYKLSSPPGGYPFKNSGPTPLISINKTNNDIFGGNATSVYYYFFNWEIQELGCLSDPTTGISYPLYGNDFWKIHPNPARESVLISYTLKTNTDMEICLYDVLGKKVTQVLKETQHAGEHQLNFDTENLQAGIYVVRVRLNGQQTTKKLVINK